MFNEKNYYELLENSVVGITLSDTDGKLLFANTAFCNLVGYTTEELEKEGRALFFKPDDERLAEGLKQRAKEGKVRAEIDIKHKNGYTIPVDIISILCTLQNGTKIYETFYHDISDRKALEITLLENQEKYKILADSAFEGVAIVVNGIIEETNQAFANMFGYTISEITGMRPQELINDEYVQIVTQNIVTQYTETYQILAKHKDGSSFHAEITGKKTHYKGQEARIACVRDITLRINSDEENRRTGLKYEAMIYNGSDMTVLLNPKGEFVFVSSSSELRVGYKPEQLIGRSVFESIHPEDIEKAKNALEEAVRENKNATVTDLRFRVASGDYIWVDTILNNMLDNEYVNAIVANSRDITERKEVEFALLKREQELYEVMKNNQEMYFYSIDMICGIGLNGIFKNVSPACFNILGYTQDEIIEHSFTEFIHPEDLESTIETCTEMMRESPMVRFENRYIHKNGKVINLMWSGYWSKDKKIMFAIARDISEKIAAASEINNNEQRFRSLFEQHTDAIFSVDRNGNLTSANANFYELVKIKPGIHGRINALKLFKIEEDSEGVKNLHLALSGKANRFETDLYDDQGRFHRIRITILPIVVNRDIDGAYCMARNITEEWQNEKQIIAKKDLLENVAADMDIQEAIRVFFLQIESIYPQVKCSLLLIKDKKFLSNFVAPSLPQNFLDKIEGLEIGDLVGSCGTACFRKIPVVNLDLQVDKEWIKFRDITGDIGLKACISYPLISSSGDVIGSTSFYYTNNSLYRNSDLETLGQISKLITIVLDNYFSYLNIKAQNTELEKMNKELDRFAYSSSHELRAPLTSIRGLTQLSKMSYDNPEEIHSYIEMIESSVIKLESFISDIGTYYKSKREHLKHELIDFQSIINDTLQSLEYMAEPGSIKFFLEVQFGIKFYSDAHRLQIIFNNLVSNSIKYKRDNIPDSYVRIKVQADEINVYIIVEDNGEGIHEKHLKSVFDMFYRATVDSRGSGLGLFIVRESLKSLQGSYNIQSTQGEGTIVSITLPLVKEIIEHPDM